VKSHDPDIIFILNEVKSHTLIVNFNNPDTIYSFEGIIANALTFSSITHLNVAIVSNEVEFNTFIL